MGSCTSSPDVLPILPPAPVDLEKVDSLMEEIADELRLKAIEKANDTISRLKSLPAPPSSQ